MGQNLLRHDRTRSIFGVADICHGQLPQPCLDYALSAGKAAIPYSPLRTSMQVPATVFGKFLSRGRRALAAGVRLSNDVGDASMLKFQAHIWQ